MDEKLSDKQMDGLFEKVVKDRIPKHRYASYDYCYNYFHKYKDNHLQQLALGKNLHISCLQLGFFLASWGMYRGSSSILQRSTKIYDNLIREIVKPENDTIWEIDVDKYNDSTIRQLVDFKIRIENILVQDIGKIKGKNPNVTDTLVTKIMMAVFGNVPAFDRYFCKGFKISKTLNEKNLKEVKDFYYKPEHKRWIDKHSKETRTLDINTGKDSKFNCTKARIIDMIFWQRGFNMESRIK